MRALRIYTGVLQTLATIALLLLFANVVLQVFSRTFLVQVPVWTEEVGRYLLVWLVALSSGILFFEKEPIGIDFIFRRLPTGVQKAVYGANLLLSGWFAFMLVSGSLVLVEQGKGMRTTALNLSFQYIYLSLTVTGIVLIVALAYKLARLLAGKSYVIENKPMDGER